MHTSICKNYLSRYGYIPPVFTDSTASNQLTKEIVSQGLWDLQDFFGLNRTGILDDATLRLMATPRCGLPDKVYRRSNRRKRYTLMGSKWTHSNITYFIRNYSENIGQHMDKRRVKSDIRMALDVWSKHSPLTFTGIKSESADIIILWGKRRHGDKQPFDGPGGTLAHAYTPGPGIGGDTHFDDDETWTAGVDHGTNLLQAATHELGHALGLGHSRLTKAVMAPTYKGYEADLALDEDDIRGITVVMSPYEEHS
ncbi:hypothetical protein RUM44_003957 [Polyplax serrata]|uniref:Peptidase metallopeptidase domain-containing protein n=1 Tax=Polyplax serrata TaxID=468196 RepID=A0ABR1B1G0_POLSC